MPLDTLTKPAVAVSHETPFRLSPQKYTSVIAAYVAARNLKSDLESQARAANAAAVAARDMLLDAMDGRRTALCGKATIELKQGAPAPAAITLTNGRKLPWTIVESLKAGGKTYPASEVATLYGGRAGSLELNIVGV